VVPEGSLLSDADFVYPTLHALRAMGVAIAVADDGTGSASSSYLQKLPVDMLEVNRSFVMPVPATDEGRPFAGPVAADRFAELVRARCRTRV